MLNSLNHRPTLRATRPAGLAALLIVTTLITAGRAADSITDHLVKPALNVVITVQDMEAAQKFYGEVLGLEAMPPIPFSDKTADVFFPRAVTMQRFRVGPHEIKLIPGLESTVDHPGGIDTGIGLRMINYPIAEIDAFHKRLEAHGYETPEINELPGSNYRFGLLEDPDGNQVEFYYYDGQGPPGWEQSIHIALTVADTEASRKFYGEVLGLEEMPSLPLPTRPDRQVYLFRLGATVIKFWSFGPDLPNFAGRHLAAYGARYLQYHVRDPEAAHEFVRSRGGTIELPPTAVESMPVDIMFVADPDGIINEMFGLKLGGG